MSKPIHQLNCTDQLFKDRWRALYASAYNDPAARKPRAAPESRKPEGDTLESIEVDFIPYLPELGGKPTPFVYIVRDGEALEWIESGHGSGIRAQLEKMIKADDEVTT